MPKAQAPGCIAAGSQAGWRALETKAGTQRFEAYRLLREAARRRKRQPRHASSRMKKAWKAVPGNRVQHGAVPLRSRRAVRGNSSISKRQLIWRGLLSLQTWIDGGGLSMAPILRRLKRHWPTRMRHAVLDRRKAGMSMSMTGELARSRISTCEPADDGQPKEAPVAEEPPQAAEHACHARLMRVPLFLASRT